MPSDVSGGAGRPQHVTTVVAWEIDQSDTIAELLRDWDLIKEWLTFHCRNARNCHRIKSGKTHFRAVSVVVLECSDC
jgi:hypothetical protein